MLFVFKADSKINPVSAVILLAVVLASLCPAFSGMAQAAGRGTVTAFKLNIRSGPSRSAPVLAMVDRGTQVDVIEIKGGIGGWVTVLFQGQKGYVRNRPQYIALPPSQAPKPRQTASHPQKAEPETPMPEKASDRHRDISEKIEKETRKMVRFTEKETEILNGLNQIDFALNQARIRSQTLAKESRRLSGEIGSIQERIQTLSRSMEEVRGYAGQRLEALYRMHMLGRLEMAGSPSSLFNFFVTQRAVKQVVASDYHLLNTQAMDLAEMVRLKKALEEQIAAKTALESDLADQIRIKEKETRKKEVILKEIRKKKRLSQAAIASLEKAAESLRAQLDSMGAKGDSPALDSTSFLRQKGRLHPPVRGEVVSRFGRTRNGAYNAFTFQSGIDIKVERGEPVRSVFKGEVMFADWLQGYGNLLIVNHGDSYYTLYAHVEEIFKKKGEAVGTGEVIATAGDTGSIKGMCLHFEVRHHGKPVDPMTWLNKGA